MDDLREKVINGLTSCLSGPMQCEKCRYRADDGTTVPQCVKTLREDAIALLKAQEAVKPYMDFDGHDVWRCGNCGAAIFHLDHTQADEDAQNYAKFCRKCGQAVKWE